MSVGARWLLALAAAAFLARAGYAWRFPQWGPGGSIPDTDHYTSLAESLLDSGTLALEWKPSAEREPGYPVFLAGVFAARRSYRLAQLAQCLLGAFSVVLLFRLARPAFGERAALAAAALMAFYPQYVYYAGQLMRETLLVFLALAGLLALAWADAAPSWRRHAAAGLVGVLSPLTCSALLPWVFAAAPAGVWWCGGRNRRALGLALAYVLAAAPLYALWVGRNYAQFHTFVLGATAGGGGNLYMYQIVPPEAAGTPEQTRIAEADPVIRAVMDKHLDEIALDKYFYKAGVERIKRDPLRFLGLCVGRLLKLWRLVPYDRGYAHGYRAIWWASLLSDGWMVPLALVGAFLVRLRRPETVQLWLMTLSTSAVYSAFWAMVRYRMPMMLAVFAFAGAALAAAWDQLRPAAASAQRNGSSGSR